MFTGIVEEIGHVASITHDAEVKLWDGSQARGAVLVIECKTVLQDAYIGCSIAVNGACLTVVAFTDKTFQVNIAPETLRRTNLGQLKSGDGVNLERAAAANSRNSGHTVQGHIDATGTVKERRPDGDALWMVVSLAPEYLRYLVPKGYVAVDGTSLTVCDVDHQAHTFSFMLVAHTQANVVLPQRQVGHQVNIEVDVLAKYVETNMSGVLQRLSRVEQWIEKHGGHFATPATVDEHVVSLRSHQGVLPGLASVTEARTGAHGDAEMTEIKRQTQTVHGAGLEVPLPTKEEAAKLRVAIVYTCWHAELINEMRDRCRARLLERGVLAANIVERACPGSFELPYAARAMAATGNVDVVVCIGILLKGGTIHMEVIANTVTQALMQAQFDTKKPMVFGVLTTLSIEQARERAFSALPASWADSGLSMTLFRL